MHCCGLYLGRCVHRRFTGKGGDMGFLLCLRVVFHVLEGFIVVIFCTWM